MSNTYKISEHEYRYQLKSTIFAIEQLTKQIQVSN